jgi:glucose/arabinose dehydrogenase
VLLGEVPAVFPGGEGGLLGVAVSPDDDGLVYLYLTTQRDNRVVRMRLEGEALVEDRVVVEGIPRGQNHNGGRVAFGPDGKLYVTTGDAGQARHSQDPGSLGGKILRLEPDGSVPADNPFPGSPVWTLGHRNVQGVAWDEDGRMFASEFGQNTWDELNVIEPGGNYGWPEVEGRGGAGEFVQPAAVWPVADASPSGLAIVDDVAYMAATRGQRLWQIPIGDDGTPGEPVAAFEGEYGRLRSVEQAPEGPLWVTTTNRDGRGEPRPEDDRILRVRIS